MIFYAMRRLGERMGQTYGRMAIRPIVCVCVCMYHAFDLVVDLRICRMQWNGVTHSTTVFGGEFLNISSLF
jgi:hypothetical protein